MLIHVRLENRPDLPEVAQTSHIPGLHLERSDRRKGQPEQDRNDANHDDQFHNRESGSRGAHGVHLT